MSLLQDLNVSTESESSRPSFFRYSLCAHNATVGNLVRLCYLKIKLLFDFQFMFNVWRFWNVRAIRKREYCALPFLTLLFTRTVVFNLELGYPSRFDWRFSTISTSNSVEFLQKKIQLLYNFTSFTAFTSNSDFKPISFLRFSSKVFLNSMCRYL